jgi:glycosyltransferase involved in cell wall biosynthesis
MQENPCVASSPPKVSVIMAVYNGEPYLAAAVEGMLHQTYRDFEFVIVDDASTDGSAQSLRGYAAADPRVLLMENTTNRGVVASRNRGVEAARGFYIAWHDADDYSAPTRLQEQVEFLDQHTEVGLLGTLVQVIDESGQALTLNPYPYGGGTDNAALQAELLKYNPFCHGSVMVRRACLSQVGNFDENVELTEDYDLWLRLAEVTSLAKVPKQLYFYRQHVASASRRRRGQQIVAQARALEKAMRRRYGFNPPPALLVQVADTYREAADFYVQQGDRATARQFLVRAITLCPGLFTSSQVYVPTPSDAEDLAFLETVLGELPTTRPYNHVRRLLRSRLHMRRAFAGGGSADLRAHLWAGLYYDPRWLLNRGVLSLTARSLLGRPWRRSSAAPGAGAPPVAKDKPS